MALVELLADKRQALIDHMMATRNERIGTSEEDTLQFVRGYVDLVERAAAGDDGPMNNYLEAVIPAIKAAGMPLHVVMDGMVRVAMSYTAVLPSEHHKWAVDFNGDYTTKLTEAWEAA